MLAVSVREAVPNKAWKVDINYTASRATLGRRPRSAGDKTQRIMRFSRVCMAQIDLKPCLNGILYDRIHIILEDL